MVSIEHNYFVAYDLMRPGQEYDRVVEGIKRCSIWYWKPQYSLFYIRSRSTASEIYDAVKRYTDLNDKVAVIQAEAAVMTIFDAQLRQAWRNTWNYGKPTAIAA